MRRTTVVEDAMIIRLINTGTDSFKLNWLNRRGGLGKSFKIVKSDHILGVKILRHTILIVR